MKLSAMWRRMKFGSKRGQLDRELDAEMEQHIEMLAREFASKGMPEDEARRRGRPERRRSRWWSSGGGGMRQR